MRKLSLENMETSELLEFGSIKKPYSIKEIDYGTVPVSRNTTPYIGMIGSAVASTRIGERVVSIEGWVSADRAQEMKARKSFLSHFINPMQEIRLHYNEYVLDLRAESSVRYAKDQTENNKFLCRFLLSFTAYDPLWKLQKSKVYQESKITPVSLFPLRIPRSKGFAFGFIPAVSINNVPNPGDVEAGFTVRFNTAEGPACNPRIINNKTGKFVEVAVNMQQGDIVEVSTVPGDKYAKMIRGNSELDLFKAVTRASAMDMTLNVGINDLTITAAGNASNLASTISFTPLWMEVQE